MKECTKKSNGLNPTPIESLGAKLNPHAKGKEEKLCREDATIAAYLNQGVAVDEAMP